MDLRKTPDNDPVFPTMMNRTAIYCWIVCAACLLNGCTVCQLAMRTVRYEPAAYSLKHDKQRSFRLYRAWAEDAWQQELQACVGESPSADYGIGFRDGFVDYVYLGGAGEPPPVPPRRYWNAALRSLEGHAGAQQWFDGYRQGAQAARSGGYRQIATLRSSLMGVDAQHSGENAEMYAPLESDFQERPFEDDLPIPGSATLPTTSIYPDQTPAEPLPAQKEPLDKASTIAAAPAKGDAPKAERRRSEPSTKKFISALAASKSLPEDINLPPASFSGTLPESPQTPSGRKIAPPLEEITTPVPTLPEAEPLKTEKQEPSSSTGSGESAVATTIEATTPRLVLVQHAQSEPMLQAPAKPSTNGLRFVNQADYSCSKTDVAPNERLILPAPDGSTISHSRASMPSRSSEIRLMAGKQDDPTAIKPSDPNGGRSTNSIRVSPTKETDVPVIRKIGQTSNGFAR